MNIVTILVTRSKACHVKTLHTVLRINVQCLQKNINNQITYVDDDPFQKAEAVQKFMKTCTESFSSILELVWTMILLSSVSNLTTLSGVSSFRV